MSYLVSAGDLGGENDRAVLLGLDALGVVPDLLLDIAGDLPVEPDGHPDRPVVDDPEGAPHVGLEVEVSWDLEGLVGHTQHFDSVEDKHPHLLAEVTPADEVEGAVEEEDPVGVDPPTGLLAAPAHGPVDHVDGPALEGGLVDTVDDLPELPIVLVRLDADKEGLFHLLEVGEGFRWSVVFTFWKSDSRESWKAVPRKTLMRSRLK